MVCIHCPLCVWPLRLWRGVLESSLRLGAVPHPAAPILPWTGRAGRERVMRRRAAGAGIATRCPGSQGGPCILRTTPCCMCSQLCPGPSRDALPLSRIAATLGTRHRPALLATHGPGEVPLAAACLPGCRSISHLPLNATTWHACGHRFCCRCLQPLYPILSQSTLGTFPARAPGRQLLY